MNICIWCLEDTSAKPTPIGFERGSQRDPYRETLLLCNSCSTALLAGDVKTFHSRYQGEKLITRE